jgi:LPXTG-motif cell wall-anchored protein
MSGSRRTGGGLEALGHEREVASVRRAFTALFCSALFLVLWASTAWAQSDYPPTPGPPGPAPVTPAAAQRGALPRTGASNTPSLIMIGLAALIVGTVLVLAVRRRRALARGIA